MSTSVDRKWCSGNTVRFQTRPLRHSQSQGQVEQKRGVGMQDSEQSKALLGGRAEAQVLVSSLP